MEPASRCSTPAARLQKPYARYSQNGNPRSNAMSLALTRNELIRPLNFIGGKWIAAANGARFPVTNPATGDTIVEVANSSAADARAATDAAAGALPAWRGKLPRERAEILRRWHALIVENT